VSDLFRQNRPVSDEELLGELELVTQFVSPLGQENLQRAYWDFRRANSRTEESPETK
jgi:hypothetical protein